VGTQALAANTEASQNTAVGEIALDATTTGSYNVGVGYASLTTNTTGTQNAALGRNSLNSNTTGTNNTAVGNHALHSNTTSSNNTAVGYQSLYVSTTGTGNVAVGYQALDANTTADNNTAVGTTALGANTTGHSNTAVGKDAGDNITTGDSNIIIGSGIDAASATADNQLSIGGWIVGSAGQITMPSQPAFNAYPASTQSNIAINTTVTVVLGTEAFDQGSNFASNTFTAPVTGKYQLNLVLAVNALDSAAGFYQIQIVTSNKSYNMSFDPNLSADADDWCFTNAVLADMDASDTAIVKIYQYNGTAQTDIGVTTNFSGYLVC